MPRPRLPPTPSSPFHISTSEKNTASNLELDFSLPSPTVQDDGQMPKKSTSQTVSPDNSQVDRTPPTLPTDKQPMSTSPRHKRTWSGVAKQKTMSTGTISEPKAMMADSLPPPPSRARKIIQMKPKNNPKPNSAKGVPATADDSVAPATSGASTRTASSSTTSALKRKLPSATSAAGRKIARKTAHSIIERRRRSKMNEEFGVLKDMIPACTGVEMHKLAILQAGIEYVRYLKGCITQLQDEKEQVLHEALSGRRQRSSEPGRRHRIKEEDDVMGSSDEEDEMEEMDEDEYEPSEHSQIPAKRPHLSNTSEYSQALYRTASSNASITNTSPHLYPVISNQSFDNSTNISSFPPPAYTESTAGSSPGSSSARFLPRAGSIDGPAQNSTLLTPAFGAIQFTSNPAGPGASVSNSTTNTPHQYASVSNGQAFSRLSIPQPALPFPSSSATTSQGPSSISATATTSLSSMEGTESRPLFGSSGSGYEQYQSTTNHSENDADTNAEIFASTALMMLNTHDRRMPGPTRTASHITMTTSDDSNRQNHTEKHGGSTTSMTNGASDVGNGESGTNASLASVDRKAMSVRDLLTC